MKQFYLYNSLSRKKELFVAKQRKVGMYVCGITPDGLPHFGHAYTYTIFDVLVRYLRHLEYNVTYVQNLTDIDDDIIRTAKQRRINWKELGTQNARAFRKDMKWLNNKWPDVYPKATNHIAEMITLVENLLHKGCAYEEQGSVYFSVAKYQKYGQLSHIDSKHMLAVANEHGNNPNDRNKKHPLDFVLWQAQKPGEPSWASPWGRGRPGWHIECSAMSVKYLGQPFDIHGGGGDLIFPHHESSRAQSEIAHGKKLAHYWMHIGMLRFQGKKMSKSLGNLVLIKDLRKKCDANTLRIGLLSHHYRSTWEFRESELKHAKKLNYLFQKVRKARSKQGKQFGISGYQSRFYGAMNDDLNIPKALHVLESLSAKILKIEGQWNIAEAKTFLKEAFQIFGLTREQ